MNYEILTTVEFERKHSKLTKRNNFLEKRYRIAVKAIRRDPMSPSLATHKVDSPTYGKVWSSSVTGDIRILWNYYGPKKNLIILLLTTGRHSGGINVYRSII
ncbi:hypothetical protein JW978_01330 [Candidatus Dojkabacteria bacterium]|nr:hypothetical protein [Candidatus Dojkabacteria bacterium]